MKKIFIRVLTLLCVLFMFLGISACKGSCQETPAASIAASIEELNLEVGNTYSVKIYGSYNEYDYLSQNHDVVTVDAYGIVKAVGVGQTEVIIKNKEIEVVKYQITVTENTYVEQEDQREEDVYYITLDKNDVTMYVGGSAQINYTVYKNSKVVDEIPNVTFVDENTTFVAKDVVSGKIVLKGSDTGKTKLQISIGKFTAQCEVAVNNIWAKQLDLPVITGLNDKVLSWQSVENADYYKVSFDYGETYTDETGTQCEVPKQLNPVAIQIKAMSNSEAFIESKSASIDKGCYYICSGSDINLCFGNSPSGKQNNTAYISKTLSLSVHIGNDSCLVSDDLIQYNITDNQLVDMNDGIVTSKKLGSAKISAYIDGYKLTESNLNVGMPIMCAEDLETLAYAAKNGNGTWWDNGKFYFLTNDIVYTGNTLHERYLVPIAARSITWWEAYQSYTSTIYYKETRWGIFGNINPDGKSFCATLDGNGYAIKNAVIPYGTQIGVCLQGKTIDSTTARCTVGNNFIGKLGAGGALKNIRFEDLKFEAYDEVDKFMYSTANNNLIDVNIWKDYPYFKDGVLDIESIVGKNGGDWDKCSNAISAGIVGVMENATVDNVYVKTVIVNNSRNSGENSHPATCGVIVGTILKDSKPQFSDSVIKNCVVETAISKKYNVEKTTDTKLGGGMGAIVGSSFTGKQSTLTNNFVITIPTETGDLKPIANDGFYARFQRAKGGYTNCKVYSSSQTFESENITLMNQITCWKWSIQ